VVAAVNPEFGWTLIDTIAQLVVTLAFLGLGFAGWLALGSGFGPSDDDGPDR
jgi:hypothetical protein